MGMNKIGVKGQAVVEVKRDGKVVRRIERNNLVVTGGKNLMASRLVANTDNAISHMACGSSNQVPAESDSALVGTEHERVSATVSSAANVVTATATFGSGIVGTVSVGEYAIFNAASSGTMLCRFITQPIDLNADEGDTFDVTWTIQFGD